MKFFFSCCRGRVRREVRVGDARGRRDGDGLHRPPTQRDIGKWGEMRDRHRIQGTLRSTDYRSFVPLTRQIPRSVVGLNFTCMHQKETVRSQGFYLTCTTYCAFSKGFSQTNFRLCMIDQGAPSENFILSISEPRRRRTAE